jgi:predicted HicB family RNase H-like nuclease
MSKPNYRATLTFDPDRKVFLARCPELEHCSGEGATRAEAVAKLEEEIDAQLANMLSHGSTPPRAVDEETFSGELTAKVSKQLHRDLAYQARSEGIDLDHLVGELLSAAMESRKQHRGPRSGNRAPHGEHMPNDNVGNRFDGGGGGQRNRGFGRGHNPAIMDDRANFIEYVRGLEQNGGVGPSRHGGGGGPGGGDRGRRRGGRGGRGGNPNHGPHNGGQHNNNRMQGGGRPYGNGGPGNGGNPGNGGGNPGNGGGNPNGQSYGDGGAPAQSANPPAQHSTPHDPDSSGNA